MATKSKTTKPNTATVTAYLAIRERRLALGRQVEALEAQEKQIRNELMALAEAKGGSTKLGNYRLTVGEGRRSVAWKEVVVDVMGADYAAQKMSEAVPAPTLNVELVD